MNQLNQNEVPAVESLAPQSTSTETEPNSVSSTTKDYTTQNNKSQGDNEVDIDTLVIPLEDTEGTIQFENDYPSKYELRELIDKCNIIRLNGTLHTYKNGIYVADTDLIRSKIFKVCENITPAQVNKILKGIELEIMNNDVNVKESSSNYVCFNNKVFDMQDSKDYEFSSADFILTNKIALDYFGMNTFEYKSANVKVIDKYFHKVTCGNSQLENFLYFIIGNCICRSNEFPFAFVLTGNNRNSDDGRREYLYIIDRIVGNCVSHENLRDLTKTNSSLELYGKTCNISEEVEHPNISYMDNIRKLILGKELRINPKFRFSPFATLLINVREILDFGNVLFGLKDYFKIIPFNAKSPISKSITTRLFTQSNLLYIALKGITVYNQVLRIGKMPNVDVVENATAGYFRDNNSVLEYCKENPINGIICKAIYYYDYCQYCVDNNLKRVSRANFGKEVRKFGYECKRPSFKGKRVQCYMEEDFDLDKCRADYIQYLKEHGDNITTDKDIIYDNLVKFINGYEETSLEDIGNGTFWSE